MKFTVVRFGIALALPLLLFACKAIPNPDYNFLGRFQKGETRSVIDSVKNQEPQFSYDLTADGTMKATHVDLYQMVLSRTIPWYFRLVGLTVYKTKYDYILFVYQNNRLLYCGTPDDLKKTSNAELQAISMKLNDQLLKEF